MTVETVAETSRNLALSDSIADTEAGGNLIVEVDVAELVEITEDDNSKKNQADCLQHLAE